LATDTTTENRVELKQHHSGDGGDDDEFNDLQGDNRSFHGALARPNL
jgi:hypothetical protein